MRPRCLCDQVWVAGLLQERTVPTKLIIPPEATDHDVAWDRRLDQCDFLCGFQSSRDAPSPLIGLLSGRRISIIGVLSDMKRGNDWANIRIE
jgi:hypothetical protein